MTSLESTILAILQSSSKEFPVSRAQLEMETGCPDRENREVIAELYKKGHVIVNLGKGYFLGSQEDDRKYRAREFKRLRTQAEKLKAHAPKVWEAVEQLSLL